MTISRKYFEQREHKRHNSGADNVKITLNGKYYSLYQNGECATEHTIGAESADVLVKVRDEI